MTQIVAPTQPCLLCQKPTGAASHPVLGSPVCPHCLVRHGSCTANTRTAGREDGLPKFSIEFEVCSCRSTQSVSQALILLKHGYLRAYDCTVSDEYKSPIYLSLAALQEALPTLEQLKDLVDDCCGTHIHVDCPVYDSVLTHYFQLFTPLLDHLETHLEETKRFWGRWPYTFLSVASHYGTLEFRLPHFQGAEQYLWVVQFCRAVTQLLNAHLKGLHASTPEQISAEIVALYQRMAGSGGIAAL
jgi:hypothetical protein